MPELPEVETVRRGLEPALLNRRLVSVVCRRPDLRFPLPDRFSERLVGQTVTAVGRRSKYLLIRLSGGEVLIGHLGMSGRFRIHDADHPDPAAHDHVDWVTDAGVLVRYHDPRRFGFMLLAGDNALADHPLIRDLGPEPLDGAFDVAALAGRLKGRAAPIKAALMDQRTVAGLGNIYVCEALFRAGISPKRRAGTVQGKRAEKLLFAIKTVLAEAIESGGSSLRDHRQATGELGYFQHHFRVYGRSGQRCADCDCDGPGIRQITQSGRSTFYCPKRQR